MKYMIICPTKYLKKFATFSNYHLVLTHMVERDKEYRNFYKNLNSSNFRVLDNSSYEVGDGVYSPRDLVKFGAEIQADEIMAPETFENGEETADKIVSFYYSLKELKCKSRIFGVLHGKTIDEIKECFLSIYKYVDTVGFSCRLDFNDNTGMYLPNNNESLKRSLKRFHIVTEIFNMISMRMINVSHLSFHLLGMNHPMEVDWYDNRIRSCDSSCSYTVGQQGVYLPNIISDYVKPVEKLNFLSSEKLSRLQEAVIKYNINFIINQMKVC